MLIPATLEFDPGKQASQEPLGITAAASRLSTAMPAPPISLSHRYLYTLELPRIHRMLRPIKAKIAAIHLAIKSAPSFGYAPVSSGARLVYSSCSDSDSDPRPSRLRNITRQYGHVRSIRTRLQPSQNYRDISRHDSSSRSARQLGADESFPTCNPSGKHGSDILVRRFRSPLLDQCKDMVEKLWWQPFCEDHDLPLNSSLESVTANGLVPSATTLGVSCAFAVGRIVAHLSEDESELMEKYYNIMPAYMRRFALLEHVVELCLSQIPIGHLLTPIVGLCARYRADSQALRLLEKLLTCDDKTYRMDLAWAYKIASLIEQGDAWIDIVSQKGSVHFFTSSTIQTFLQQAQPGHRATLIRASFDVYMDKSLSFVSERARRSRVTHWTALLIEDSLRLHERNTGTKVGTRHDAMVEKCNAAIEYMARRLFNDTIDSDGNDTLAESRLKDAALGLALHSLYISVTASPSSMQNGQAQEWIELLELRATSDIGTMDFDVVVRSYGTLPNLIALALMLDAVGLYTLSIKLINRMLSDFRTLDKETRKQLGYACDVTASTLEAHLREIRQRRSQQAAQDRWRFDDLLGDWVERTPKAGKIKFFTLDDDDDDDDDSEEYVGSKRRTNIHFDSSDDFLSTPPPRSSKNNYFDTSPIESRLVTPPRRNNGMSLSSNGQLGRRQPQQEVEASPYVLRRAVRYSMTPVRRSTRSTRQEVHYDDSGPEFDDEEDMLDVQPLDLSMELERLAEEEQDVEFGSEQEVHPTSRSLYDQDEDYVSQSQEDEEEEDMEREDDDDDEGEDASLEAFNERESEHDSSVGGSGVIILSDGSHDSDDDYNDQPEPSYVQGSDNDGTESPDQSEDRSVTISNSDGDGSDMRKPNAALSKRRGALHRGRTPNSQDSNSGSEFEPPKRRVLSSEPNTPRGRRKDGVDPRSARALRSIKRPTAEPRPQTLNLSDPECESDHRRDAIVESRVSCFKEDNDSPVLLPKRRNVKTTHRHILGIHTTDSDSEFTPLDGRDVAKASRSCHGSRWEAHGQGSQQALRSSSLYGQRPHQGRNGTHESNSDSDFKPRSNWRVVVEPRETRGKKRDEHGQGSQLVLGTRSRLSAEPQRRATSLQEPESDAGFLFRRKANSVPEVKAKFRRLIQNRTSPSRSPSPPLGRKPLQQILPPRKRPVDLAFRSDEHVSSDGSQTSEYKPPSSRPLSRLQVRSESTSASLSQKREEWSSPSSDSDYNPNCRPRFRPGRSTKSTERKRAKVEKDDESYEEDTRVSRHYIAVKHDVHYISDAAEEEEEEEEGDYEERGDEDEEEDEDGGGTCPLTNGDGRKAHEGTSLRRLVRGGRGHQRLS